MQIHVDMVTLGQQFTRGEQEDRRSAERLSVALDVMMTVKARASTWHETDAAVLDLSQSGVLVRCDRVPPRDSQLVFRVEWHGYGTCLGYGAVVRVSRYGGFAARFDRVNWAMQDFLGLFAVLGQTQRSQLLDQLASPQITIE